MDKSNYSIPKKRNGPNDEGKKREENNELYVECFVFPRIFIEAIIWFGSTL